jgi:adenylosuccinate synthase
MQAGKFNIIIDGFWGSSGKGKISTYLADQYNSTFISSANYPNAGHSAVFENGVKFVAKAIPTSAILKKVKGTDIQCFLSPGSGFNPIQLLKEWEECDRPNIFIHDRASIMTSEHALREREGSDSTKHIASTMQGSGVAIADKIMRRPDVQLAKNWDPKVTLHDNDHLESVFGDDLERIRITDGMEFRNLVHSMVNNGQTWLHEGSQGYSLSIDHGSQYPYTTSRNCGVQAAMDYMAIPPQIVGDVYLNLRTYPIRVGNVVENGQQLGYSGDFYPDCTELTWKEVARRAGMPDEEAQMLAERERTTVTKRIRRVCNFSYLGLQDAVRTNGATKLSMNFIQYIDWSDAGLRGGKEAFKKLSKKSRTFIDKVEEVAGVPVVLIGTGASHEEIINLL